MAHYEDPDFEDYDAEDWDEPEDAPRESPEVYRRRRIIAGLIALVLVILLVWAVVFAVQRISAGVRGTGSDTSSSAMQDNFADFSARPSHTGDDASAGTDSSASAGSSASASAGASASTSASATPTASASAAPSATASATPSPSAVAPTATASTSAAVEACGSGLSLSTTVDKSSYASGQNPVITVKATNSGSTPCTVDLGQGKVTYQITSGAASVWSSTACEKNTSSSVATLQAGSSQTTSTTWNRTVNSVGCGSSATAAQTGYYWVTATVNGISAPAKLIVIS